MRSWRVKGVEVVGQALATHDVVFVPGRHSPLLLRAAQAPLLGTTLRPALQLANKNGIC